MNTLLTAEELEFFNDHVCAHVAPHSTQTPEQARLRDWTFQHKPTNDKLLKAHLSGKQSLALPPRWYPVYGNLDIDKPKAQEKLTFDKLQEIGIKDDQFACFTTPRFRQNGNFRIYFNFQLHGKPVTAGLYEQVLKNHFQTIQNLEYNPRRNISDRLIAGFGCELIDTYSKQITKLDFRGKLDVLRGLRPVEVSELPIEKLPEVKRVSNFLATSGSRNEFVSEAEDLLENGLQKNGCNRHFAQSKVLFLLWLKNSYNEVSAAEFVKNWIRAKHNGLSKTADRGDWRRIDREIERQAKSVYVHATNKFPDTVHNRITAATATDVIAAAKYAPADAVRQKQFFNLLKVIRPNLKHEYIYIPAHTWINNIASDSTYIDFQRELENKGLMVSNRKYLVGVESRKYKFNFRLETGAALSSGGRNLDCYYEALKTLCRGDQREIHALTGINRMTLWRNFQKLI